MNRDVLFDVSDQIEHAVKGPAAQLLGLDVTEESFGQVAPGSNSQREIHLAGYWNTDLLMHDEKFDLIKRPTNDLFEAVIEEKCHNKTQF